MFLRLNEIDDMYTMPIWVNMNKVVFFTRGRNGTMIQMDEYAVDVKETPEEIMERLQNGIHQ